MKATTIPTSTPLAGLEFQRRETLTNTTYRKLKARAALTGITVQALVEQAIDEFLTKPI
jgi:hypothetical protein